MYLADSLVEPRQVNVSAAMLPKLPFWTATMVDMFQRHAESIRLCDLENRLDFHRRVARQRTHAHGAAGARAAFLAEYVDQQLAAPVDDGRLVLETRGTIYHAQYFDDTLHPVETAQFVAQCGQERQTT